MVPVRVGLAIISQRSVQLQYFIGTSTGVPVLCLVPVFADLFYRYLYSIIIMQYRYMITQVLAYMEKRFFKHVFLPVMAAVSRAKKIAIESAADSDSRCVN